MGGKGKSKQIETSWNVGNRRKVAAAPRPTLSIAAESTGGENDISGGREMGRPLRPPRPSLNLIVSIIGFSNTVM